MIPQHWQTEWLWYDKVEFDGTNRLILIHPEVVDIDVRVDIWSAWVRWVSIRGNSAFFPAMRRTGYDPTPSGKSGDIYFTINGWKLICDVTKIKMTGVLFSDNFETAFYDSNLVAVYPIKVSSVVNTSTSTVVVPTISFTLEEVVAAVWGASSAAHKAPGSIGERINKKLLTFAQFLGLK